MSLQCGAELGFAIQPQVSCGRSRSEFIWTLLLGCCSPLWTTLWAGWRCWSCLSLTCVDTTVPAPFLSLSYGGTLAWVKPLPARASARAVLGVLCPRSNLLLEGELFWCRRGSLGLLWGPDDGTDSEKVPMEIMWLNASTWCSCKSSAACERAEARGRVTSRDWMLSIFTSVSRQPSYQRYLQVVSLASLKTSGGEMPDGATLAFALLCPEE